MQQQSRVSLLLSHGKQIFICFIHILYLHHARLVKNGWPRNFPHCSVTLMLVAAEDQGTQSFPPLFQKSGPWCVWVQTTIRIVPTENSLFNPFSFCSFSASPSRWKQFHPSVFDQMLLMYHFQALQSSLRLLSFSIWYIIFFLFILTSHETLICESCFISYFWPSNNA